MAVLLVCQKPKLGPVASHDLVWQSILVICFVISQHIIHIFNSGADGY